MNEMCDKLIIAVLTNDDATEAVHHLNEKGFYATTMSSAGGFLKKGLLWWVLTVSAFPRLSIF